MSIEKDIKIVKEALELDEDSYGNKNNMDALDALLRIALQIEVDEPSAIGVVPGSSRDSGWLAGVHVRQTFDLIEHLRRQRAWSEKTFGPGDRSKGVIAHIRKELDEIAQAPFDLEEWIDVVLLAFDGAWRAGYEPDQIADALYAKLAKNEKRAWPDWRTASRDKPIEHVRVPDPPVMSCNMHKDCNAAEAEAARLGIPPLYDNGSVRLEHCSDKSCECCFSR